MPNSAQRVWVVWVVDIDNREANLDSIWLSQEKAEARAEEVKGFIEEHELRVY